jgi:hypothetical protein
MGVQECHCSADPESGLAVARQWVFRAPRHRNRQAALVCRRPHPGAVSSSLEQRQPRHSNPEQGSVRFASLDSQFRLEKGLTRRAAMPGSPSAIKASGEPRSRLTKPHTSSGWVWFQGSFRSGANVLCALLLSRRRRYPATTAAGERNSCAMSEMSWWQSPSLYGIAVLNCKSEASQLSALKLSDLQLSALH